MSRRWGLSRILNTDDKQRNALKLAQSDAAGRERLLRAAEYDWVRARADKETAESAVHTAFAETAANFTAACIALDRVAELQALSEGQPAGCEQ